MNGRKARRHKTYCLLMGQCFLLFEEYLQEKTSVYILKPCQEAGQSFEESPQGGELVINKNLEIL